MPSLATILSQTENAEGEPRPIRIVPKGEARGLYETYADSTMEKILAEHGEAHLSLVLATILQSANNANALLGPIIEAVSTVILAHPTWTKDMTKWMLAFDVIGLLELYEGAKVIRGRSKRPAKSDAVYMLLADRLMVMLEMDNPQRELMEAS